MAEKKISVRLSGGLLTKLENWTAQGTSLSDTVRQALILLPNSPEEISQAHRVSAKIKPLQRVGNSIQGKMRLKL